MTMYKLNIRKIVYTQFVVIGLLAMEGKYEQKVEEQSWWMKEIRGLGYLTLLSFFAFEAALLPRCVF